MIDEDKMIYKLTVHKKRLFDKTDIAWAENIPEKEFMESEAQEVG